jgi:hypothetical protein
MTWRIDPKSLKEKAQDHKSLTVFVCIVIVAILARWLGA